LEEALGLSFDRLLMMMMMMKDIVTLKNIVRIIFDAELRNSCMSVLGIAHI